MRSAMSLLWVTLRFRVYGQSQKVGKCVPACLVLKPNLPTFRFGQSDTPHRLQKEKPLIVIFQVYSPWYTPSQRPATPHPVNGHPALPYARIRGSSGSFVVLPVLEENTLTEGLGTASTWGKAIARAVDSRQYLGHCAYGYECVLKLPVVGSAVPSIVCESRQYLGQSIVAWLRMRPGTASTQGTAIPPCPRLFLNPASIWGKAQWAWL